MITILDEWSHDQVTSHKYYTYLGCIGKWAIWNTEGEVYCPICEDKIHNCKLEKCGVKK